MRCKVALLLLLGVHFAIGQKGMVLTRFDSLSVSNSIRFSIFDYIKNIDSTSQILPPFINGRQKIPNPDHLLSFDLKPDPFFPGGYVIDILDWILVKGTDTVPVPLPRGFNPAEKRYYFYCGDFKSQSPTLWSGQAMLQSFNRKISLLPMERLRIRLVRFGIYNTVYPVEAYYQGFSVHPRDSAFWASFKQRHCGDFEDCDSRIFVMQQRHRSKIVLVEDEDGVDGHFNKLKIISYEQKYEEVDQPCRHLPPSDLPPCPPIGVDYWEEVVVPVRSYPRSYQDIEKQRTRIGVDPWNGLVKGMDPGFFLDLMNFCGW